MSILSRFSFSLSILVLGLLAIGCESGPQPGGIDVSFDIVASRSEILAGENVTFTAMTNNTYGRDAEIEWQTTGGDMRTIKDDLIRRITFDDPGTYKVSADLMIDGRRVDTDTVTILVRNLQ